MQGDQVVSAIDEPAARAASDWAYDWIRSHFCRRLARAEYLFHVAGFGDDRLNVPEWPLEIAQEWRVHFRGEVRGPSTFRVDPRALVSVGSPWPSSALRRAGLEGAEIDYGTERADVRISGGFAGYLMPGQIETWAAGTAYVVGASRSYGDALGSWVAPARGSSLYHEVAIGGTSGTIEPSWRRDFVCWESSADFGVEDWLLPGGSDLYFSAASAGTSGVTEPTWPTAAGETVADGDLVWTAFDAPTVIDGGVTWRSVAAREMDAALASALLDLARWRALSDAGGDCEDANKYLERAESSLREMMF